MPRLKLMHRLLPLGMFFFTTCLLPVRSPAAALPLFSDDFSTPALLVEKWKLNGAAHWQIEGGSLQTAGGGVRTALPNVTHDGPVEISCRVRPGSFGAPGEFCGIGVRGVTFMLVPGAVAYAYRVTGQERSNGGRSALVDVQPGNWYDIRIVQKGEIYECYVNDSRVFQFRESNPMLNGSQLFSLITSKPPTAYDNVSIAALPAEGASTSPNLLRNASFETVPDTVPLFWKPAGMQILPQERFWQNWRIDNAHAHSGKRSLLLTAQAPRPSAGFFSASNGVAVNTGKPSTFSIYLKADHPNFKASMVFYEIGSGRMTRQNIEVGTDWGRYSFTHPGVALAQVSVGVTTLDTGSLWADDAQLENGATATDFALSAFEAERENKPTPQPSLSTHPPLNPVPKASPKEELNRNAGVPIDPMRRCLVVDGGPFLTLAPLIELNHVETAASISATINHYADAGFRSVTVVSKIDQPSSAAIWGHVFAQCAARHLKVVAWPARTGITPENYDQFDYGDFITRWKEHPALLAWLPVDEPEIAKVRPEQVVRIMDQFKKGDPTHPAFVNYTTLGIPNRYAGLPGDILSLDDYLTNRPDRRVREIVQQVDIMEAVARETKRPTFLFVVGNNLHNHFREPTASEQVAQTYGCVTAGANGIMYFLGPIANKAHWEALRQTNQELLTLTEVIYSTEPVPEITCSSSAIRWMARRVGTQIYLITVNLEDQPVEATFTIPSTTGGSAVVLFENRTHPFAKDTLTQTFKPHQRHVYRLDLQPEPAPK